MSQAKPEDLVDSILKPPKHKELFNKFDAFEDHYLNPNTLGM
jgi:hypothetical protein